MKKHLTLICCATILSGTVFISEETAACGEIKGWFCDKLGWFCSSDDSKNMSEDENQMPDEVIVIEEVESPDVSDDNDVSLDMVDEPDELIVGETESLDGNDVSSDDAENSNGGIVLEEEAPEENASSSDSEDGEEGGAVGV